MRLHMIGNTVDIVFYAADISKVTIKCPRLAPCFAVSLKIQSHSGAKPLPSERLTKKGA